jgi:hypothetical protein
MDVLSEFSSGFDICRLAVQGGGSRANGERRDVRLSESERQTRVEAEEIRNR